MKCNIHPWMHGYFVVVKGPYATTDDKGSYTIENVPAGSYTVTAWQEEYGTQTQKVTVAAGKPGPLISRSRPSEKYGVESNPRAAIPRFDSPTPEDEPDFSAKLSMAQEDIHGNRGRGVRVSR